MSQFYMLKELKEIGLGGIGRNVLVKNTVQFYTPQNIFLGNNVIIDDYVVLVAEEEKVTIGNNVHIGPFSGLYGRYGIEIGDYAGISDRVAIYSESDDYSGQSMTNPTIPMAFKPKYVTGLVRVGEHVIIGTNSTLMPNVTVGEGVAIGAYTFVKRDCEPWWIYVGNPAKKFMKRHENLLEIKKKYLATRRRR